MIGKKKRDGRTSQGHVMIEIAIKLCFCGPSSLQLAAVLALALLPSLMITDNRFLIRVWGGWYGTPRVRLEQLSLLTYSSHMRAHIKTNFVWRGKKSERCHFGPTFFFLLLLSFGKDDRIMQSHFKSFPSVTQYNVN